MSLMKPLLGILLTSSCLFAQSGRQQRNMKQTDTTNSSNMTSGYNHPARTNTKGDWDGFVMAEFLYMQGKSDGMDYLTAFDSTNGDFQVYPLSFDWKPGFRIGTGICTTDDDWDAGLVYTYLRPKGSSSASASGVTVLEPNMIAFKLFGAIAANPIQALTANNVSANWSLSYNVLDFYAGRRAYQGKNFTVRPFAGLRTAWNSQTSSEDATGVTVTVIGPTDNPFNQITVSYKSKNWQIGPRVGLDLDYLLGMGFKAFGDLSASLLYSSDKVKASRFSDDGAGGVFTTHAKYNLNPFRPNLESKLGLGWGDYFYGNSFHFDFNVAYEFTYWWNTNYMNFDGFPVITKNIYDMYIQGLSIEAKFDF